MTKHKKSWDETPGPHAEANAVRSAIDAGYVNLVMSGIRQAGHSLDNALVRAGLEPRRLTEPNARLSQREFARLLSVMTRVTRDEFWSLCSRPIKPGTFRTMCKLVVRCSNLREAISTGCQFYHLVVGDFTVRFREDDGEACVWVTDTISDPDRRRMINGALIFFIYGLMCWLVGRRLPLTTVQSSRSVRSWSRSTTRRCSMTSRAPNCGSRRISSTCRSCPTRIGWGDISHLFRACSWSVTAMKPVSPNVSAPSCGTI
jgi:hypothetical protein